MSDSFFWIVNIAVILITILLLNQCIFPLLRNYTPNMLKRIGIGYVLTILSVITLLVITFVGQDILEQKNFNHTAHMYTQCMFTDKNMEDPHSDFVFLPINSFVSVIPHGLLSIAEVFFSVTSKILHVINYNSPIKHNLFLSCRFGVLLCPVTSYYPGTDDWTRFLHMGVW